MLPLSWWPSHQVTLQWVKLELKTVSIFLAIVNLPREKYIGGWTIRKWWQSTKSCFLHICQSTVLPTSQLCPKGEKTKRQTDKSTFAICNLLSFQCSFSLSQICSPLCLRQKECHSFYFYQLLLCFKRLIAFWLILTLSTSLLHNVDMHEQKDFKTIKKTRREVDKARINQHISWTKMHLPVYVQTIVLGVWLCAGAFVCSCVCACVHLCVFVCARIISRCLGGPDAHPRASSQPSYHIRTPLNPLHCNQCTSLTWCKDKLKTLTKSTH